EFTDTSMFDFKKVNLALKKLEKQANKFLDKNSIPKNRRIIEFYCEARYPYQVVEQLIPLKVNDFENEKDVKILKEDFHKVHENINGEKEKNNIECVNWQVRAIEKVDKVELLTNNKDTDGKIIKNENISIYLNPEIGKV